MPNNGRITLCPYYVNEQGLSITCEDTIRIFRWPAVKSAWMDHYCDCHWQECEYAVALQDKYEKGEEMNGGQEINALRKELKKVRRMLSESTKREKAKDSQLAGLKKKNRALETTLMRQSAKLRDLLATDSRSAKELMGMAHIYETRFAYLMDVYSGGKLREADVEKWADGKEFAVTVDGTSDDRTWKVVIRDADRGPEPTDAGPGEGKTAGAE